ncbi:cAMP-binding domain of CRP or a regulatory subunit of cAMP-dependent protein kinases [Streptomyces sp. cf124]|nr:cAMP-binding domain of CRP or a regulatory subunit of cAMP-dependent protein kinases [Streptomyces sp. cf124]
MLPPCAAARPSVRPAHRAETFAAGLAGCCAVRMTNGSNPDGRVPFLDTLSPRTRAAFTRLGALRRYALGDVLIREGDHAQELMVLHEGLVKVTARLDRDRAFLTDIRIAGDVVGEVAVTDAGPRSATVTACGDVLASVVPAQELESFLDASSETSQAFRRMLCVRLRRSDRLRLELGRYPVPVRLARVLVELAESYGRPRRTFEGLDWNRRRIDVNLSQSEFAALTASTTDTVHKALARLRNDRIITTGSRQTDVLDMGRLRAAARPSVPAA